MNKKIIFALIVAVLLIPVIGLVAFRLNTNSDVTNDSAKLQGATTAPVGSEPVSKATPADYIGLKEVDAEKLAKSKNLIFRVVKREGVDQPVTADLRTDRIDVVIENGTITAAYAE